jgi:hypothetical protein
MIKKNIINHPVVTYKKTLFSLPHFVLGLIFEIVILNRGFLG